MGGIYFEYATTIIINRMLKFWMKVFWSQKQLLDLDYLALGCNQSHQTYIISMTNHEDVWKEHLYLKFSETIERHLHSHMITDIWLYKKKEKGFTVSSLFTLLGKYTAPAPAPDG